MVSPGQKRMQVVLSMTARRNLDHESALQIVNKDERGASDMMARSLKQHQCGSRQWSLNRNQTSLDQVDILIYKHLCIRNTLCLPMSACQYCAARQAARRGGSCRTVKSVQFLPNETIRNGFVCCICIPGDLWKDMIMNIHGYPSPF